MLVKEFIKNRKFRVIAEVGVNGGNHVTQILGTASDTLDTLYMIDPWRTYKELGQMDTEDLQLVNRDQDFFDQQAMKVYRMTQKHPKIRVIRLTSRQAADVFPNEFFDFVFIDADHSFGSVIMDIRAWYPKVKRDGFLAGHDYSPGWPGVTSAVNEVFGRNVQTLDKWCWCVQMARDRQLELREKLGGSF